MENNLFIIYIIQKYKEKNNLTLPFLINKFIDNDKYNNLNDIVFYKLYIRDSSYYDENDENNIDNIYVKCKKYSNVLNRFVYRYKLKKAIK